MLLNDVARIKGTVLSVFEKYQEKVEFAYLFGSVARSDTYPLSDIDIAVYLSGGSKESLFVFAM